MRCMHHESWTVVRKVRLRADLKPVGVYGADAAPLTIDWLTVVHHYDDEGPLHEIFGVAQEEWEIVEEDARSSSMVSWVFDPDSA